jgi:hypothetical protein
MDGTADLLARDNRIEVVSNMTCPTRIVELRVTNESELIPWATANAQELRRAMTEAAIIVAGTGLTCARDMAALAQAVGGRLLDYRERSTPRKLIDSQIYTSTEYPAQQTIVQHNENSYQDSWPDHVFFLCKRCAEVGGETPVADGRVVLGHLPAELVEKFRSLGVLYTRTFRAEMGLSWQESFQTDRRSDIERYCSSHDIKYEWEGETLRTRQRRPATMKHRLTGEEVWFNQAHLFHVSSLPNDLRDALVDIYGEEALPRNAYFGDGSRISDGEICQINDALIHATAAPPWSLGNVLMIDNVMFSHGRNPFSGVREVLVGMTATDGIVQP